MKHESKETEHTLVKKLIPVIRDSIKPGLVYKHSSYTTAGWPDIETVVNRVVAHWEVKHAHPKIKGTGLQLEMARRLERHGRCYYIVYLETSAGRTTNIVDPSAVGENGYFAPYRSCDGFDHRFVADFIRSVHALPALYRPPDGVGRRT